MLHCLYHVLLEYVLVLFSSTGFTLLIVSFFSCLTC